MVEIMIRKIFLACTVGAMALTACVSDGGETIPLEYDVTQGDVAPIDGIPGDEDAGKSPAVTNATVALPDVAWELKDGPKGVKIAEITMPGVQYPDGENWLLYIVGTGGNKQSLWVTVDGDAKGCQVLNGKYGEVTKELKVDFVFVVNNSNNMKEAGDLIAATLDEWNATLEADKLSMAYYCVGYGGGDDVKGVDGACDRSTAEELKAYLNRDGAMGTARTKGFAGNTVLEALAKSKYQNCDGECGVEALKFANEGFGFRATANRVYLNVTDEPNQPGGNAEWSVESLRSQDEWAAGSGTIHTLFSGNKAFENQPNEFEHPWLVSSYTGGFTTYTDSKLTGITLKQLPLTESVQRMVVIRIAKVEKYMDGKPHNVKITMKSNDEKIQAEKTYKINFGTAE